MHMHPGGSPPHSQQLYAHPSGSPRSLQQQQQQPRAPYGRGGSPATNHRPLRATAPSFVPGGFR